MKVVESLRIIFASYEALFLSIILVIYFYYPAFFISIGSSFQANNEILKFIPSIPLVVCGFSAQYAWKILMPLESGSNRILHEWPNYWKLKFRVFLSVTLCAICVLSTVYIWFFIGTLSSLNAGAIYISSTVVALTVAFNQFLAAFKIRELIEP
jgi:hypothetical protein